MKTEELPDNTNTEPMLSGIDIPSKLANASEVEHQKKQKILSLYEKALDAEDYEMAKSIDTSSFNVEELKEVRKKVFLKKLSEKVYPGYLGLAKYRLSHNDGEPGFLISYIKNILVKLELNPEDVHETLRESYSSFQDSLIKILGQVEKYTDAPIDTTFSNRTPTKEDIRKHEEGKEKYREVAQAEAALKSKEVFEGLSTAFDLNSKEDLLTFKEKNFLQIIIKLGQNGFSNQRTIDLISRVCNLKKEDIESVEMEKMIAKYFFDKINSLSFDKDASEHSYLGSYWDRKHSNSTVYNEISYVSRSPLFPKNLNDYPKLQEASNKKFLELSSQLKIVENNFVPSEYLREELDDRLEKVGEQEYYKYIERLIPLIQNMKVSTEVVKSSNFKDILAKYISDYFSDLKGEKIGYFGIDNKFLAEMGFPNEDLVTEAKKCYLKSLDSHNSQASEKIRNLVRTFPLSTEFKHSPESTEKQFSFLKNLLSKKNIDGICQFLSVAELSPEFLKQEDLRPIKKSLLLELLSAENVSIKGIYRLLEKLDFSDNKDIFQEPEIKSAVENLIHGYSLVFREFSKHYKFSLSRSAPLTRENGQIRANKDDYNVSEIENVHEFIVMLNLVEKLENPTQLHKVIRDSILSELGEIKHIYVIESILKSPFYGIFKPEELKLGETITDLLIKSVGVVNASKKQYDIDPFRPTAETLKEYQTQFKLNSVEIRKLALASFNFWVKDVEHNPKRNIDLAKGIFDEYHLTAVETASSLTGLYSLFVTKGWDEMALKIKKDFNLQVDSTELETAKQSIFISSLEKADIRNILKYCEALPIEFLRSNAVQISGRKLFLKLVTEGQIDNARKIKTSLDLNISVQDILVENPLAKSFIEKLQSSFPRLAEKYLNSVDAFLSIYSEIGNKETLETLEKFPFLAEALNGNEQYALKLIFKFNSLDQLSKKNIETLYKNKKDIVEQRPDINENSRDFRIAMQNRLESYRRNPEIILALQKAGINTEEWLNHEDEMYFELGEDEKLKFSDTIVTPIERVQETINHYIETVKGIFGHFKNELVAFRVPLKDLSELKQELETLQTQKQIAEKAGNQKKIVGISKGIASLEEQIANPKELALWDKIFSRLATLDLVKKDVFKAYDLLREAEIKLSEQNKETSTPQEKKRKEFAKLKEKIEQYKKELKEKFSVLERRMDEFQNSLQSIISPALGEDRTESLIQEIQETVSENMDHYDTDRTTLANIFLEKEEKELTGQPIKISVWDRNPDIDLYLGNYTNCCIRIDSDYDGAESAIADYLTDLGVQIVSVYDEKKGMPIAAAWCWVGHDDTDQLAFVIDNIEANTDYLKKHKTQLENKLKEYIQNYAKKVGAKLVQGTLNNDLLVAKMDSAYFKLGGYNRPSGYHLEGENNRDDGEVDVQEQWAENEEEN
ncbi:MAG: hypothetical protein WC027_02785 [Candidatus Paceibacterota bacterium]